ncbi:tail fiber assembly protein [Pantoea sp. DY-5]|uniref:tail fiber assembly protein n=1 Tax=Pantoea sp. DY-5 TaxID=2871488 RepID=UPI002104A105|nr:tail fiber assembly protein [Pantoea sp. DY-5]
MNDENEVITDTATQLPHAYENRYFIALNDQKYIVGMLIAFTPEQADAYSESKLAEITQQEFESIGPDCQYVKSKIVHGKPMVAVLSAEASKAILSARLKDAGEKIQTLQDAIEFGMEKDGDNEMLTAMKKYRVLLSQSDITQPLENWPADPSAFDAE